jgi:pyruvate ferredoxin oxidoreductase alpha subunit
MVAEALAGARRVVVVERALAVGAGGIVSGDVRLALAGTGTPLSSVVAGLGGRPVTTTSLRDMIGRAVRDELGDLTFLDLDTAVVDRELARLHPSGRTVPS